MAKLQKQPTVVAELGRPETAAETTARKAKQSYLYKKRKTLNNLIYSLLVTLGFLALIVLIVPRGTGDFTTRNVDVQQLAEGASDTFGQTVANPAVGDKWLAKQAKVRFDREELVTYWYIGYTTPSGNYAGVAQGHNNEMLPADARWVNKQLEGKKQTGTASFAGYDWQVYDHSSDSADSSNVLWAYVTELPQATLIVSGTGSEAEIRDLAEKTAVSLTE
ncbi:DUF4245 domain-containing protein [Canibacter zhoujuaniae]|uniref:DUF4245 domain-containing protein n=1 Tax=Canibacter zhoujuaniae TaxID=2708343 RepID=UPI00142063BE|nr:DUF4245 domain-containing protein [Canibacter zhoujuaniae]